MDQQIWAGVGKLGALVAVAVGVVQIWQWWASPSEPRVEAACIQSEFSLPPDLAEAISDLSGTTQSHGIRQLVGPASSEQNQDCLSDVSARVAEGLREQRIALVDSSRHRSMFRCTLRNIGEKPATDVVLQVPVRGIAEVVGQDMPIEFDSRIPIGSLLPHSGVEVNLWSDSRALSALVVSHSQGSADADMAKQLFGWRAWLGDNFGFLAWAAMVIAPMLWGMFSMAGLRRDLKKTSEQLREPPKD